MSKVIRATLLPFLLFLIIGLPVTSCGEKESTSQEDLQALLAESSEAMRTVEYIKTSSTGSFIITIPEMPGEVNIGEVSGNLTTTANINLVDNEYEMKMDTSMDMGEMLSMKMTMDYWLVDEWYYIHLKLPVVGDKWIKTEQPIDNLTELINSYKATYDIFLEKLTLEYVGIEDINGNENYRIKIIATEESFQAIFDWILKNTNAEGSTSFMDDEKFTQFMSKMIDGMTFEIWIDKNTKLMSQNKVTLDTEFSIADLGLADLKPDLETADIGNIRFYYDITQTYTEYPEAFTIIVPEEALNAEELSPSEIDSIFQ